MSDAGLAAGALPAVKGSLAALRGRRRADRDDRTGAVREAMQRVYGTAPAPGDARLAAAILDGGAVEAPLPERVSLVAGLVVAELALAGRRCHVLASSGIVWPVADEVGPLLDALAIRWGRLEQGGASRTAVDRAQVLFGMTREVALDLLRARARGLAPARGLRRTVQRLASSGQAGAAREAERDFALVLDGEETLCRRALTMVVGKGAAEDDSEDARILAEEALGVAMQLRAGADFRGVDSGIALSVAGRQRLGTLTGCLGNGWENRARGELLVGRALEALHLWQADRDYRVDEEGIELIGPSLQALEAQAEPPVPSLFLDLKEGREPERSMAVERVSFRSLVQSYRQVGAIVAGVAVHGPELRDAHGLRCGREPAPPLDAVACSVETAGRLLGSGTAGPCLPILIGGEPSQAEATAAAIRSAGVALALPGEHEAAEAGFERAGGLPWLPEPARPDLGRLGPAPTDAEAVLVAIDNTWFPPLPSAWRARRSVLLWPTVARGPRRVWHAMLSRGAEADLPFVRSIVRKIAHRRALAGAKNTRELRRKLHEFDAACRRAASFLVRDAER